MNKITSSEQIFHGSSHCFLYFKISLPVVSILRWKVKDKKFLKFLTSNVGLDSKAAQSYDSHASLYQVLIP